MRGKIKMFKKNLIIISITLLFILMIGVVQASNCDNLTNTTSINQTQQHISVETKDFKTYVDSKLYFKAKVYDNDTKQPIKNVKVSFKIKNQKGKYLKTYNTKSNVKGIAILKKDLKIGNYKIYTYINKKN